MSNTLAPAPRRSLSLVWRLTLGLGLVGGLLWAGYTYHALTTSRADFHTNTDHLIEDAESNLVAVTDALVDTTETYRDTLVDSILQMGEWQLEDAPLAIYPDEAAIRRSILARWRTRTDWKREASRETDRVIRKRVHDDVHTRIAEMKATRLARAGAMVDAATWRSLVSALLVAVALVVVFSVALYVTVIRPVRALTGAARGIGEGDLSRRVEVRRRDEFGVLATTFNGMVTSLQAALGEVEALNTELEQRVADKTAALERTVAETREANDLLAHALDDLKATQARLLQAEKMSAIGTLAGGVAHEFNNLLGGIMGSAEAALEEEDLGPEARPAVEMIRRTAERACLVTENLLRFARPADESAPPVRLEALAADALRLVEPEARKHEVTIRRRDEPALGAAAVSGELHQVVLNLLVNAVHASPAGGTVTVSLSRDESGLGIAVEDEGPGIAAEHRERIFDPFFTTKSPGLGTGLGLSVSYGIVQRHGGRIEVEPRAGGGTRFVVRLPAD